MSGPYAKLPNDKNNNVYLFPNATSQQATRGQPASIQASSVITFSPNTTTVEVTVFGGQAGNSAVVGKWGSASVTGTNFDFVVQSGQSKLLAIPVSVFGSPAASIAGANQANGLYSTMALANATPTLASVLTVEYT